MRVRPCVPAAELHCCTFQGTVCKIKMFALFFVFVLMYYLCEKYYKPITVQYYIAHGVSWVRRLIVLDLEMYSLSRTYSYVGHLLYHLLKEFRKTC